MTWVVQHRTGWLTAGIKVATWLGSSLVVILIAAIVVVALLIRRRDARSAVMLISAVGGAIALYDIVTPLVGRARPPSSIWIGRFSGFAFPSEHATLSVAFYGMLAFIVSSGRALRPKSAIWFSAAVIALLVGASRIYLGGHWLSDVLGGYALGATWVALVVAGALATRTEDEPGDLT